MWRRAVPGVYEKPHIPSFVLATVRVLDGARADTTIWTTTDMFDKTVKQCIRLEQYWSRRQYEMFIVWLVVRYASAGVRPSKVNG